MTANIVPPTESTVKSSVRGLTCTNGVWHIRTMCMGKKINRKTDATTEGQAERAMQRAVAGVESSLLDMEPGWERFITGRSGLEWARARRNSSVASAKRRGLEFKVTVDELLAIGARSRGRCEYSGIPFYWSGDATRIGRRPFAPSFDRIDFKKGYIKQNLRLVSLIVNTALMDWGDDAFSKMCWAIYMRENGIQHHQVQNTIEHSF